MALTKKRYGLSVEDRFWSHVDKKSPDECWLWLCAENKVTGYGNFTWETGRVVTAHKAAYKLSHNCEVRGRHILHRCDVKLCCNPAHLYMGTPADNARDRVERGLARGGSNAGEANPRAKLTLAQVAAIKGNQVSHREAKQQFDLSAAQYYRIRNGESW